VLPKPFTEALLADVRSHLTLPMQLGLPVFGGLVDARPFARGPGDAKRTFDVELGFVLHGDGRLTGIVMYATSMSAPIDDSVIEALRAADSAQSMPPIVGLKSGGDSAVFAMRVGIGRDTQVVNVAMATLSVPVEGPFEPVQPEDGVAAPLYPDGLRRLGVSGSVYMSFVVDEGGRVMLDTRSVRSASAGQFRDAVLSATPRMQFKPARLRGCPVKQLVGQVYNFKMRH